MIDDDRDLGKLLQEDRKKRDEKKREYACNCAAHVTGNPKHHSDWCNAVKRYEEYDSDYSYDLD